MKITNIYDKQLQAIEEAEMKVRVAKRNLKEAERELDETLALVEAELNEQRSKEMWIIKTKSGTDITEKFENLTKAFTPTIFDKLKNNQITDSDLKRRYSISIDKLREIFAKFTKKEIEDIYNFDNPTKVEAFLKKLFPSTQFSIKKDLKFNAETDGGGIDNSCQPKMHDAHEKFRLFKKKD